MVERHCDCAEEDPLATRINRSDEHIGQGSKARVVHQCIDSITCTHGRTFAMSCITLRPEDIVAHSTTIFIFSSEWTSLANASLSPDGFSIAFSNSYLCPFGSMRPVLFFCTIAVDGILMVRDGSFRCFNPIVTMTLSQIIHSKDIRDKFYFCRREHQRYYLLRQSSTVQPRPAHPLDWLPEL
jgi:hypothetical protein